MKKRNFKIVCLMLAIFTMFSLNSVVWAAEESNGLVFDLDIYHVHDDGCEYEHESISLVDEFEIVATAECYLGHWFTTTEYRTGGSCGVRSGTTCWIVVYEVKTCNHCGKQISHQEYSRREGCIFLSNH